MKAFGSTRLGHVDSCVAPPVASVTLPPSESRTCLSPTLLVVGSIRKQRNKLVSSYFYISTAQVETFGHTILPAWVGPGARCGDADLPKGPSGRLLAQREEVEEAEFPGLRWYVQVCSWSDFGIYPFRCRVMFLSKHYRLLDLRSLFLSVVTVLMLRIRCF